MLCSEALLVVFLVNWVATQWRNEDDHLRKDLRLKFVSATDKATDSLVRKQFSKNVASGATPVKTALVVTESHSYQEIDKPARIPSPKIMLHKRIWSNGQDSVTLREFPDSSSRIMEGLSFVVAALMPDSEQRIIAAHDTAFIRSLFVKALKEDNMHFGIKWLMPNDPEGIDAITLHGSGLNRLQSVSITGYKPFLLRRIVPQLLFALTLIAICSLAFLLAFRSLRRERRLSAMRSSLVSNMSHELKTPVTTVKVALEALGDDEVLRDQHTVREYVSIANQELQRLEMLVNQTLHTSLMESGKLPIQRTPIDFQLLTIELVNSLQPRIEKQAARVQLSFEDGDYSIDADKLHVQGVLLNIMDNALKYGGDGVIIQVMGKSNNESVSISVSDNGPGIPKAYQQRVFEKFFRVPAGDLHNVKGYGLGLSYAAEVVRLHGGTIRLDTSEPGGCTFTIEFPKESRA
jgi:signal transduction histidine kinase